MNLLVLVLTFVYLYWITHLPAVQQSLNQITDGAFLLVYFFMLSFGYVVGVLMHELGHLLAALHFKFRVYRFQVLGLSWEVKDSGLQFRYQPELQKLAAGSVMAVPQTTEPLRLQHEWFWFVFWGPATNLIVCLLTLFLIPLNPAGSAGLLSVLSFYCFYMALANFLPRPFQVLKNDGWWLWRILRGQDLTAGLTLIRHQTALLVPLDLKDWSLEPLEDALKQDSRNEFALQLKLLLAAALMRHQNLSRAEQVLMEASGLANHPLMEEGILLEEAFLQARLHHHPAQARAMLLDRRTHPLYLVQQQRVEAAILLEEGNILAACKLLEESLGQLAAGRWPITSLSEQFWMRDLMQEAQQAGQPTAV